MSSLEEGLARRVQLLGRAPRSVIIDDEVATIDEKSPQDWNLLLEEFKADSEFFNGFQQKMNEAELPMDTPVPPEMVEDLIQHIAATKVHPRQIVQAYKNQQSTLKKLSEFVRQIGFETTLVHTRPKIADLGQVDLFLIDYQLWTEEAPGETAVDLIREVMNHAEDLQQTPPMVVLMSKSISAEDVDKWDGIARQSGYFRINYDFLNKADFERDPRCLVLQLTYLLHHKPIAECYYSQIRSLLSETQQIAKDVSQNLFQVTPAEAEVFRHRIEQEGTTLSEVFTRLFGEYVSKHLKTANGVRERMESLQKAIKEAGAFAPPATHRHALHKLYADLLFTDCSKDKTNPPGFGDIYTDGKDAYYLVLTQECDLMPRGEKGPKVDRVLTIEGRIMKEDVSSAEASSIVSKPILRDGDDLRWFWWDARKPHVIPYATLAGSDYRKVLRLNFADAEDIQHKFSSSLTRVALDVMPGFVVKHECRLYSGRNKAFLDARVPLYELVQENNTLVAFAPECRELFFGLGKFPFLQIEKVIELGRFKVQAEFLTELRRERIYACLDDSGLFLYRSPDGAVPDNHKFWGWEPPKPNLVNKAHQHSEPLDERARGNTASGVAAKA